MPRLPIGLQLYSIRDDCARDLRGSIEAVGRMGYEGVEFAGYHGFSARELRKLLDDNGLKCCGTHTGLTTLLGDQFEATAEFNRELGNRYLIVPGLPEERRNSRAAWLETAGLFNELSERAAAHDMLVGYHNHTVEFEPMDGELPWDTFFGNTLPEVVMQFDTGNAMHGGAEAPPFLERYPGRAKTVHLKEYASGYDKALIGEGDIPWQRIFELCEGPAGTEWYIVEQEIYSTSPLECVAQCLKNLKAMGK